MAQAAKQRHTAPELVYPPPVTVSAGTWIRHETHTSGKDEACGAASWKAAYQQNSGLLQWPTQCALCDLGIAKVAAHVITPTDAFAGVGLVPCCSGCNNNPLYKQKQMPLIRETVVVLVPQMETMRIVQQQQLDIQGRTYQCRKCVSGVMCYKSDCGGGSKQYCCLHCSCRKKGVKCKEIRNASASEEKKEDKESDHPKEYESTQEYVVVELSSESSSVHSLHEAEGPPQREIKCLVILSPSNCPPLLALLHQVCVVAMSGEAKRAYLTKFEKETRLSLSPATGVYDDIMLILSTSKDVHTIEYFKGEDGTNYVRLF